jgi:hypothetical protein
LECLQRDGLLKFNSIIFETGMRFLISVLSGYSSSVLPLKPCT